MTRQRVVRHLNAVGLPGLDPSPAQSTGVGQLAVLLAEKGEDATLLPVGGSPLVPESRRCHSQRGTDRVACECDALRVRIE